MRETKTYLGRIEDLMNELDRLQLGAATEQEAQEYIRKKDIVMRHVTNLFDYVREQVQFTDQIIRSGGMEDSDRIYAKIVEETNEAIAAKRSEAVHSLEALNDLVSEQTGKFFCDKALDPLNIGMKLMSQYGVYAETLQHAVEYGQKHGYNLEGIKVQNAHYDLIQDAMIKANSALGALERTARHRNPTEFAKTAHDVYQARGLKLKIGLPIQEAQPAIISVDILKEDGSVARLQVDGYIPAGRWVTHEDGYHQKWKEPELKQAYISEETYNEIMEKGVPLIRGKYKEEREEEKAERAAKRAETKQDKESKGQIRKTKPHFTEKTDRQIAHEITKDALEDANFDITEPKEKVDEKIRKLCMYKEGDVPEINPADLKRYFHLRANATRKSNPEISNKYRDAIRTALQCESELAMRDRGNNNIRVDKHKATDITDIR